MAWGSRNCDSTGQGKKADSQSKSGTKVEIRSSWEEAGENGAPWP